MIPVVKAFFEATYPSLEFHSNKEHKLTIEQLSWQLDSDKNKLTPEQAMVDKTPPQLLQIKRIGGRLNALECVLRGDYQAFVAEQAKYFNAYNEVLSEVEFNQVKKRFEGKDSVFLDTLKVCTIVGGINLTPEVRKRASALNIDFVDDSVQGMADLFENIDNAKKIFPLVDALFEKNPASHARITRMLQAAFSKNTHLRHMLYTECNQNGFRNILNRMQQGALEQEGLDFTINYWLTDIFGFRANVCPKGSIYYTHNTHIAFEALCLQLNRGLAEQTISPQEIFESYLLKRAEWLGLDKSDLPTNDQMLLAHLGAMMRLFNEDHGQLLAAGLKLIPDELRQLSAVYFEDCDPTEPTPTYVPALFANAIECRQGYYLEYAPKEILGALEPIKRKDAELRNLMATMDATALFLSFYLKTLQEYRSKRKEGGLKDSRAPLSYRNFAYQPNIEKLFKSHPIFRQNSPFNRRFNAFDTIEPTIGNDGQVGHQLKGNPILLKLTNWCYLKLDAIQQWYYSTPSASNSNSLLRYFSFWRSNQAQCAAQVEQVLDEKQKITPKVVKV